MTDEKPPVKPITPLQTGLVRLKADTASGQISEKVFCDRCGGGVYRMHAVWRCSQCGYKSDCCGW
jgi:ribosomal protein L37AE/L43A